MTESMKAGLPAGSVTSSQNKLGFHSSDQLNSNAKAYNRPKEDEIGLLSVEEDLTTPLV